MLRKLKKNYVQMSEPAKASMWYVFCNCLQKGIALFATPIFTRMLSTNDYGVYTVYQSWYSILIIFTTLNMFFSVYNNGLVKYEEDIDGMTSSMLGLCTTLTISLGIIVFLSLNFWIKIFGLSKIIIVAMFVQLVFEPATNFWMAKQRFRYKYVPVVIITLLNSFISTILSIVLVKLCDNKGEVRVISYIFIQVFLGMFIYFSIMKNGMRFFSKKYWKYAMKFNIPLIPHYLSYTILNQADRLMISYMVGKSEAAIYSVAYTIAMMMQIVTQAISNSLTPYIYQAIKGKKYDDIKRISNILLIFMGLLCVGIMFFSPEILKVFASKEYLNAVYVMPPVVASTYFMFLYPLFSTIEYYYEKTYYVMVASTSGAVANIIMNFIFIKKCGFYAAGYTTLVCYIIFAFVHYYFCGKVLENQSLKCIDLFNIPAILIISSIVIIMAFISLLLYQFEMIRYILLVALIVICLWNRNLILKSINILKR